MFKSGAVDLVFSIDVVKHITVSTASAAAAAAGKIEA